MQDYTNVALLINAVHIARDRYVNLEDDIHLSTTANIPEPLRLQPEYELHLEKPDLVDRYTNEVQANIFKQYVTNSVSIIDGIFEDVYEVLLREYEAELNETQITNRIRSAWSQNQLINYFLEKSELQNSANPELRLKESFDRYLEYRIIRHSLVHNKGVLSAKHIRQLDELYENCDELSQERSMRNSPFYEAGQVDLDINIILGIRKFLYSLMSYFIRALEYKNCA